MTRSTAECSGIHAWQQGISNKMADRRGDRQCVSIPECANWTEEQVGEWIESLGLPQYKVGPSTSSQVDAIFVGVNLP